MRKSGMPSHSYYAAAVMLELLRDSSITVRLGDLGPNILGEVDFIARVITINRAVTVGQFRATLVHELVHLHRGPCYEGREDEEEQIVTTETALMLVPPELVPPQAQPDQVARAFCVDEDLARVAIGISRFRTGGGVA